MKVNKHGLKIKGLKKCAGECVNWSASSGCESQIFYNMKTGEIWQVTQIGDSWTKYKDPGIVLVATTSKHATMQQLADWVKSAVEQEEIMRG